MSSRCAVKSGQAFESDAERQKISYTTYPHRKRKKIDDDRHLSAIDLELGFIMAPPPEPAFARNAGFIFSPRKNRAAICATFLTLRALL